MEWSLLRELTVSQMKARYRRTWAGFVWVVLNPILMYGVQATIFKHVLRIDIPDYALFLLGGLLPWTFFVVSIQMGIPVLQGSRELLLSFRVPPHLLVLSSVLDNGVNFVAAFAIVLVPMILGSGSDLTGLAFLPLAVAQLVVGTAAATWLLSFLNVFYRDVRFVSHFVLNILFFLTPVFYPRSQFPADWQWVQDFNPVYALIEPVRQCLYGFSAAGFGESLAKGLGTAAALTGLSLYAWTRRRNEFYFSL